jgi:hypothetical protein
MKVLNIHEKKLPTTTVRAGALIDSISSPADALWPYHCWPRMQFDRPLAVGAVGGHGPIGYNIAEYLPGQSITFTFTRPKGFHGRHGFDVIAEDDGVILRHTLTMDTAGLASITWPLIYRPLHDALLTDCLTQAEASLGLTAPVAKWSLLVRFLRWLITGGKRRPQIGPRMPRK